MFLNMFNVLIIHFVFWKPLCFLLRFTQQMLWKNVASYFCCWQPQKSSNGSSLRISFFSSWRSTALLLYWKIVLDLLDGWVLDFGIPSARLHPYILSPSSSPISYWWAPQQFKLHVFFKHLNSKESNHSLCSNPASVEKCKCFCCERTIWERYLKQVGFGS